MSTPSVERRALALLDEALDQPEPARERWVVERTAGDEVLQREVLSLLRAARRGAGVLDAPPLLDPAPELRAAVRHALADRYELEREIGRGGMATVYLAHERKHDRDVVIKVLDPAIAQLFGAARFLREVRIAATLAHPHIVPLIDSGDADGFLYYVMPWMEGETLRERLRRAPPGHAEALTILRDIAGALAFAHAAGVVHRDLKPENVLLTAGHAYLLDFGIAKLLDDAPGATMITTPGLPLGTRRYMAPEQAMGSADLDARADVYAWGIMGAELFTGEMVPPGEGEVAVRELLERHATVPRALARLLRQCVATDPARRPASMDEIAQQVDPIAPAVAPRAGRARVATRRQWRGVAVGAVVIGLVGYTVATWRSGAPGDDGLAEPLAATLLRNETGDSRYAAMGRFAGDWITDGLQSTGLVRVVPWSEALMASERASGAGAPVVAAVREEVKAGTVVTGAYYLRRDSLHFHAELTDARSGRLVSTLTPVVVPDDSAEAGIAQLRDRVMGAVAAIRDERVASLPGITRSPPSFAAYRAFDEGFDHYLSQRYAPSLAAFREAVARDTTFTLALLMGARAAWNADDYGAAESLVVRARAQQRDLGVYHESALRYLEALLAGDGAAARAAIQRAAELAPNSRAGFDYAASLLNAGLARPAREQLLRMDPDRGEMRGWSSFWTQRAHAAYLLGNHDEGLQAAREMARRHPDRRVAQVLEARALAARGSVRELDSALAAWEALPANVYWSQGTAMVVAAQEFMRRGRERDGVRYGEQAVAWLTNRLVATPNERGYRYWLGTALYDLGRYEEARAYFEPLTREFPERTQYRALSALVAVRRGDRGAAETWLAGAPARDHGRVLLFRARMAAVEGDTEPAITLLTQAVERGVEAYPWFPGLAWREFTPLSADPRVKALLEGR